MEGKRNINIGHPEAWELLLSIDGQRVNYILFTPSVAGSLVVGETQIVEDGLQGFEDAIYGTPELLGEFKRVRVVVRSQRFLLLPSETVDPDCLSLLRRVFPDDEGDAAVCLLPENDVKIAYLMPRGLQAFLGRTFNYPTQVHHLMPLCEHFKQLNRSANLSRMFLHMGSAHMDMAIYRDGLLQCANTFNFTNVQDATYFALNAWRSRGLDQLTDELQLLGDSKMRAAMTPELRQYVKFVMPAVYPAAAMRLGRAAMQAPLELILLALCE